MLFDCDGNVHDVAIHVSPNHHHHHHHHCHPPRPLRWTAPEVVKTRVYNTTTDVYSFGVLIFEVFSFGEFPFDAIYEDDQFIKFLSDETAAPLHTQLLFSVFDGVKDPPKRVLQLLKECVSRNPAKRPGFVSIADRTAKPTVQGVRVRLRTSEAAGTGGAAGPAGGGGGGGGRGGGWPTMDAPDLQEGYLSIGPDPVVTGTAALPPPPGVGRGKQQSVYNGFDETDDV